MEAKSMENKTNLHEDSIREILLRLPMKSLIRFKCVSKSWLSLLSNDNFAKLHLQQTASLTPKLVFSELVSIVDPSKAVIRYIDPELEELEIHSGNLVSPFPSAIEAHHVSVLGVCRGFILLGHSPKLTWKYLGPPQNLLVWNPSTGIHKTLSYSETGSALARLQYSSSIDVSYSFEYDAFTDDYFVVIAWIHNDRVLPIDTCFVDRIELFSIRTNSWKQFDATQLPCTKPWYQPALLFVNGAIHWLAIHNYDRGESVKAIIAFDLTKRNCSEIPLPHDGLVYDGILRLKVIGGCLCLLLCGLNTWRSGFAELWIMKEYKVNSSWTKCNYVSPHATPLLRSIFSPIYFTKDCQIIGSYNGRIIAKINDKGELLQKAGPEYGFRECHIYTESLLSLPTDSGQA